MIDAEFKKDKESEELYMKCIYESSGNLNSVLENLLSWSRLQMDNQKVIVRAFNLCDLVEQCIGLFKFYLEEKQIQLHYKNSEKCIVLGDYEMINSIIRNLISNAIKFSHSGGLINIETKVSKKNGFIELVIEDHGIGISQKELAMIDKGDVNCSKPGTKMEKGSGIGLSICKEFAARNNGYIHVSSTEGEGSCFTLGLPRADNVQLELIDENC